MVNSNFQKIIEEVEFLLNNLQHLHGFSEFDIQRIAVFVAALSISERGTREEFFTQIRNTSLETVKKLNKKANAIAKDMKISEEDVKKIKESIKKRKKIIDEDLKKKSLKRNKKKILN